MVALAIMGTDVVPQCLLLSCLFRKSWDWGPLESTEQVRAEGPGGCVWLRPPRLPRPILGKAEAVLCCTCIYESAQESAGRFVLCSAGLVKERAGARVWWA